MKLHVSRGALLSLSVSPHPHPRLICIRELNASLTAAMSWRASRWRKDRHYLHVAASAFRADKAPNMRNVDEDRLIWQAEIIKRHRRLVIAAGCLAMDGEACFASRSGMRDGLGGRIASHVTGLGEAYPAGRAPKR